MYEQSNPAAHHHDVDIQHASIHRVDDSATGCYVRGDRVHLQHYKAAGAEQLAAACRSQQHEHKQLQLLASQ